MKLLFPELFDPVRLLEIEKVIENICIGLIIILNNN